MAHAPTRRFVPVQTADAGLFGHPALQPSLRQRLRQQLRWGDYLVAGLFGLLATASLWLPAGGGQNSRARSAQVLVNNVLQRAVAMQPPQRFTVNGGLGEMTVEVAAAGVRIAASTCPNQFCVRQGYISRAGQILVCVPNHVVILLVGQRQNDLDAITY